MSNTERFAAMIAEIEAAKKAFVEKGTTALNEAFKEIFEAYPEISVIKWTQYTPYWNDGEECTFSANDIYCSNAKDPEGVSAWGDYEGDDEFGIDGKEVFVEGMWRVGDEYPLLREVSKFIHGGGEDIVKEVFGDHVEVTVTRDGIETTECDHD